MIFVPNISISHVWWMNIFVAIKSAKQQLHFLATAIWIVYYLYKFFRIINNQSENWGQKFKKKFFVGNNNLVKNLYNVFCLDLSSK